MFYKKLTWQNLIKEKVLKVLNKFKWGGVINKNVNERLDELRILTKQTN